MESSIGEAIVYLTASGGILLVPPLRVGGIEVATHDNRYVGMERENVFKPPEIMTDVSRFSVKRDCHNTIVACPDEDSHYLLAGGAPF